MEFAHRTGYERRALCKTIAYCVRELCISKELLHGSIQFCASNSKESEPAPKERKQFLARNPVQNPSDRHYAVNPLHKKPLGKERPYLPFVYLLNNKGHAKYYGRLYAIKRRHKNRWRGYSVKVNHVAPSIERVEHAYCAFVCVRERQQGEKSVALVDRVYFVALEDVGCKITVRKHHTLRCSGGSGGIDYGGYILCLWHGALHWSLLLVGEVGVILLYYRERIQLNY